MNGRPDRPLGLSGELDSTYATSQYICQWEYTPDQHGEDDRIQDWSDVNNMAHESGFFNAFRDEYDLSMSYTGHQFETQMQEWGN